jgi:phosphate starvation-inducible PhoH-like protein
MTRKISLAAEPKYTDLEIPDNNLLLQVLGPNDSNVKIIKKAFKIKIWLRGNLVKLSGQPAGVIAAEGVFAALLALAESGKNIETGDVTKCIHQVGTIDTIKVPRKAGSVRTPKKVIVPKTDNQAEYIKNINTYDVTFGVGLAGSGKSWLAMACAIESFFAGDVRKIILCRPAVEAGEKLGFLPGDLAEKINPYLRPLYDALDDMVDTEKYQDMIKTGIIEVAPLAFLRGRSLNNSFIILDEAQNTTVEQMKMFLTRMGAGSKMVINGDCSQVDLELYNNQRNGLEDAIYLLKEEPSVAITHFTAQDVVRHPVVQRIVSVYEARENRVKEKLNEK